MFFALIGDRNVDGALYLLLPLRLNNLNEEISDYPNDKIPFIDIEDTRFKKYLPTYFNNNEKRKLKPIAGLPLYPKGWIKEARVGFTFFQNDQYRIDNLESTKDLLYKIIIKNNAKLDMLNTLRKFGLIPPAKEYILHNLKAELFEK